MIETLMDLVIFKNIIWNTTTWSRVQKRLHVMVDVGLFPLNNLYLTNKTLLASHNSVAIIMANILAGYIP